MARNISVVILVGGNGTRLQWVVADRPKALSELTQRRKVARVSFPSRLAGLRAFAPRGLNPDACAFDDRGAGAADGSRERLTQAGELAIMS